MLQGESGKDLSSWCRKPLEILARCDGREACCRRGGGMSWQYNQPPFRVTIEKAAEESMECRAALYRGWSSIYYWAIDVLWVVNKKRNKANRCRKIYNKQTERLIFGFTLLLTFQECLSENPVLLAAHKTLKVIILIWHGSFYEFTTPADKKLR